MTGWSQLFRVLTSPRAQRAINLALCVLAPLGAFLRGIALLLEIDFSSDPQTEHRRRLCVLYLRAFGVFVLIVCLVVEGLNATHVIHLTETTEFVVTISAVTIVALELREALKKLVEIIDEILAEQDRSI